MIRGYLAGEQYVNARGERVLAAVDACAQRHGVAPAAISLAWLLHQPTVTSPIASARTVDQLLELLDLGTVHLTDNDLHELDGASG